MWFGLTAEHTLLFVFYRHRCRPWSLIKTWRLKYVELVGSAPQLSRFRWPSYSQHQHCPTWRINSNLKNKGVMVGYPRPSTGHQLKSGLGWQWPQSWHGVTAVPSSKRDELCQPGCWWAQQAALWHCQPSQTLTPRPAQCHPKHPGMARLQGSVPCPSSQPGQMQILKGTCVKCWGKKQSKARAKEPFMRKVRQTEDCRKALILPCHKLVLPKH